MRKTMNLSLFYTGGVEINHILTYEGDSLEEIAHQINSDENQLLSFMRADEDSGEKCFVFGGFMFKKTGLLAAYMTEGVI